MRIELTEITPEQALNMLSRNTLRQRTLTKSRVNKLAHAIIAGQWKITHQPIAIDPQGNLLDGQHRLSAIVEAGQAVKIHIAWDADPETFGVIDVGGSRTTGNILQIAGYTNVSFLGACARLLLAYDAVAGTTQSLGSASRLLTQQDILDFLEQTEEGHYLSSAIIRAGGTAAALGHYGLTTGLGVFIDLIEVRSGWPDTAQEFLSRLHDGAELPAGSPILALRRYFIGGGVQVTSHSRKAEMTLALLLKCWNDYVNKKERSIAVFKLGIEPMPRLEGLHSKA